MSEISTTVKEFGLPDFSPPVTVSEARARIAELNAAIASIDDQARYRELSNTLDAGWYRKAKTSRRYKSLERDRLQNWILDQSDRAVGARTLNDCIVEVVRGDYLDDDWEGVLEEANAILDGRATVISD